MTKLKNKIVQLIQIFRKDRPEIIRLLKELKMFDFTYRPNGADRFHAKIELTGPEYDVTEVVEIIQEEGYAVTTISARPIEGSELKEVA